MLDIEELVINQMNKILREKNISVDFYDIQRIKLAIEHELDKSRSSEPRYLVVDLEATTEGVKGFEHEIIEVGAVVLAGDGARWELGNFESFVKPEKNPILSDFCKNLTNIKQEDVDRAPDFKQVMCRLENWLWYDHYVKLHELVLCSWGEDKKLLRQQCVNSGIPYNFGPARNIALDYKAKYKMRHASLKSAIDFFKLTFEGTQHRALADANNTARIFSDYILNSRDF